MRKDTVRISKAEVRLMLTWVGKRPLTQVKAYPVQQATFTCRLWKKLIVTESALEPLVEHVFGRFPVMESPDRRIIACILGVT